MSSTIRPNEDDFWRFPNMTKFFNKIDSEQNKLSDVLVENSKANQLRNDIIHKAS
jgi:hypothetical protein